MTKPGRTPRCAPGMARVLINERGAMASRRRVRCRGSPGSPIRGPQPRPKEQCSASETPCFFSGTLQDVPNPTLENLAQRLEGRKLDPLCLPVVQRVDGRVAEPRSAPGAQSAIPRFLV